MRKVEKLEFLGNRRKSLQIWSWMVDTQVTDTPIGLSFMKNLIKKEILILETWKY